MLNIGGAVVRRALLAVSGLSEAHLRRLGASLADSSEVAGTVLAGKTQPRPFSLPESMGLFDELERARGPVAKGEILQQTLARLSPLEARYIVKILLGDLRIGLKEGLLEEALAAASGQSADDIREANMLLGNLGRVALLAREGRLKAAELTLFQPIKIHAGESGADRRSHLGAARGTPRRQPHLPPEAAESPLATPEKAPAAAAVAKQVVWVEDKFDGVRTQLHCEVGGADGPRVEIYSRDLRRVTGQFEEIAKIAAGLKDSVIFDGEIVAYKQGKALTFFDLQKRLGRRAPDLFMKEHVPIVFLVFDLLHLNGRSLLAEPLAERRRLLEGLALPNASIRRVDVVQAASADEIEAAFVGARAHGNEGLIIKDPASLYTPGRRGLAWLKLKKELATLDVVVVGAEWGHGKRNSVLSDYTFAVRDAAGRTQDHRQGVLRPDRRGNPRTDRPLPAEHPRHARQVPRGSSPDVVLEIAFDSIQPSTRHTSGLADAFPAHQEPCAATRPRRKSTPSITRARSASRRCQPWHQRHRKGAAPVEAAPFPYLMPFPVSK